MVKSVIGTAGWNQTLQALIELVEALERRVPRPHVRSERQIAADSAELHAEASERIRSMRQESVSRVWRRRHVSAPRERRPHVSDEGMPSTASLVGQPHAEHAAVHHLQNAARTRRPALIPGALEPQRDRSIEVPAPIRWQGPPFDASASAPHPRNEHERGGGGAPAPPVTVGDRLGLLGLRITEAFIRLLATPARV